MCIIRPCLKAAFDDGIIKMENKLQYVKGDLFSCPSTHSLAHCISMDCRMGAGIAVLFKKKFEGVEELLEQSE